MKSLKKNVLGHSIAFALTVGTLGLCASGAAIAQDAGTAKKDIDRIEVTGSRVPRADTETASPVQVISRQEIERSGKLTIAEYLQTITADNQGSVPKSFGNGFASGSAGISLRGLGAGSTLVLLNGRRIAPYGLADDGQKVFADLSTIPTEAVERVEVLKDGASAMYGSDAIAGVVNIILRRNFQGVVVKATYGASEYGDGDTRKASVTFGGGDLTTDGYNAFLAIDASKSEHSTMASRGNRKWIGQGDTRPWGYAMKDIAGMAGWADGAQVSNSPVGNVRDPATGLYQSLPGCAQFTNVTAPSLTGGCLWDIRRFRDIAPAQQYINLFGRFTYAINDQTEFYAEAGYSKKKSKFINTPSGVSGSWGYPGGPVNASSGAGATVLGAAHPDNPFGVGGVRIRYSAWDVGPRINQTENDFWRFVVGLKGVIGEWGYNLGYMHSQSDITSTRTGFLQYSRVRQVLGNGNASPVGWWRLGVNSGLNSQALYDYISPTLNAYGSSNMNLFDVNVHRSLMDLPGGSLGLAIGAEYRSLSLNLRPTTLTNVGDIIGLGYSAYRGTEKVTAVFTELNAPVLESLELNGALRYDSYGTGESAVTPKFGVKWKPASWMAVRGTYGEGFRAPNAAERNGALAAFSSAIDPVRCPNGAPLPGAAPAPSCSAGGIALVTTGNPNLRPEKSKTYTLGFVLDPTSSTSMTFDLWKIKRSGEINTEQLVPAILAGHVVRNDDNLVVGGAPVPGTGTIAAVLLNYVNSSSTTVNGWDFDIRQRFDIGSAGKLSMDLQWTRLQKYERLDGGAKSNFAGTHGNCDVTNCIGTPKDRINFGTTWDITPSLGVSAVVNYRGSFKNVYQLEDGNECAFHFADGTPAPRGCRIPSFYTIGLSARWRPIEALEISGNIDNLTDRIAPLDPTTYGAVNYNPLDFSGAIGRYYTLTAKYTF